MRIGHLPKMLWLDVYKSNYSATPETKLRSIQVKLNLRAIVTNIALHCFDIADSDKRMFCKTERETLLHLFCSYSSSVLFWENVISWIEIKLKLQLNLQPFNLLIGVEKEHDYHLIINCLLLHARFFIYKCKIAKEIPNMHYVLPFHSKGQDIRKRNCEAKM